MSGRLNIVGKAARRASGKERRLVLRRARASGASLLYTLGR
jgi:hypothetical protein